MERYCCRNEGQNVSHHIAFLWGLISCLSEQWLSGVSKKIASIDWSGRKGTCNLPLCLAPSLSAGWDLNAVEYSVCAVDKDAGTAAARFKSASEWLSSRFCSFANWWDNVCWAFQATSRVRNTAKLGIFCWRCSTALLLILFRYF